MALLDHLLKERNLSDQRGAVRFDEFASDCVKLIKLIHAQNLRFCDEVTSSELGEYREKAIDDLECLLAKAFLSEEWDGQTPAILGKMVAQISSRYIDLQYAIAQPCKDLNLRQINEILADLTNAKLELACELNKVSKKSQTYIHIDQTKYKTIESKDIWVFDSLIF